MAEDKAPLDNRNRDQSMPAMPTRQRSHGHVVDCDGQRAVIMAVVDDKAENMENYWAVGQFVTIVEGENRVVGQTYKVEATGDHWADTDSNTLLIHIELVGEISRRGDDDLRFSSGITVFPRMGALAHRIRAGDLEAIYRNDAESSITVGALTQDAGIPAKINLDKLMSRHFAVVGSTGVGKSTAVSLILRKVIAKRSDIRILILDPHNEFSAAFHSQSVVKDARNLHLPFWLFMFDEFREVVFRGQKGLEVETELLRDLVAEAKERYGESGPAASTLVRRSLSSAGYTADSPVPYRLADVFKLIDERLGQLEGKAVKPALKSLRDRLTSISNDPRFAFTFGNANSGGDRMMEIVSDIFRVPHGGRPVCVVDMSALPSEVVNSVASVLCRIAFDLAVASQGGVQTLVVCEEAHRYIPADEEAGFWPTRQSIARIAKEGRKYGVYLGIITQRPSELDPTIFSQCNTVFAMRLSNQADQRIIGGAMTNGAQTSVNFLSSIADRECIAFGEGLKTPMRLTFETIAQEELPGNHIQDMQQAVRNGREVDLVSVIRRMRDADRRTPLDGEDLAAPPPPQPLPQREVGSADFRGSATTNGDDGYSPSDDFPSGRFAAAGARRDKSSSIAPADEGDGRHPAERPSQDRQPSMLRSSGNSIISAFRSRG